MIFMLTSQQKRELKARAHKLKPVIIVGSKGVTDPLLKETDKALHDHELIKVRIPSEDKKDAQTIAQQLCEQCHAVLIGFIGRIAILYRKRAPG